MIDTHTHPYLEQFEDGGAQAVERALEAGVTHMVLPNVDESSVAPILALHSRFPAVTSVAMGLHPTEVNADWRAALERILQGFLTSPSAPRIVAIGEVGMDLYWDVTFRAEQAEAFAEQLRLAERHRLPVIIHCREALDDTLAVIARVKPTVPLIFHSFTGSPEDVRRIREVCQPWFGINGVVTYKNAQPLRDALPVIGLDRILLETDAPYLAPVPKRGRRNEPAYVAYVRDQVAASLSLDPADVDAATEANAKSIFTT